MPGLRSLSHFLEGGMDDEKSMTEKLTDALGKATDSVKSTIGNMVDSASGVAQRAMESNAARMSGQSVAELDSEQAAGSVNGQVYLPAATDAAAMPVPLAAVHPLPKPRKARAKSRTGKTTAAPKKAFAKKSNKKPAKKPAAKSAPKKSPKKSAKKAKKRALAKPRRRRPRKNPPRRARSRSARRRTFLRRQSLRGDRKAAYHPIFGGRDAALGESAIRTRGARIRPLARGSGKRAIARAGVVVGPGV
jgi:hypothetical protein